MINNDIEGSDHCPIELDLDLEKLWNMQKYWKIEREKNKGKVEDNIYISKVIEMRITNQKKKKKKNNNNNEY